MKKGVFTLMNYLMPKVGVLSMHCSATVDPSTGTSSVLFGLSGTGKTTLSADPNRELIGDDEHCWTDGGIFNIEGGRYAKTIDLSPQSEPEIFRLCGSARCSKTSSTMTRRTRSNMPMVRLRRIPEVRIPSSMSPTRIFRVWPVIRAT